MELFIEREQLLQGLTRVQRAVDHKNTLQPQLSHTLLQARDGYLRMTGTDAEVAFIGDFPANVIVPGEISVPAAQLFQITKQLPVNSVSLKSSENHFLQVSSGQAWYNLPGYPGSSYAALPEFDGKTSLKILGQDLAQLIDRSSFAISTDDTRQGLNGAHLETAEGPEGAQLRMVATDGHRLTYWQVPFEGELGLGPQLLLPRKAILEIRRLCDRVEGEVELVFGESSALLQEGDTRFFFRLIDGHFPGYKQIIPRDPQRIVRLDRLAFASVLKRMGLVIGDQNQPVRFSFQKDELSIHARSDLGESKETMPVELDGEPMEIGFNIRYLHEVVSVAHGDTLVIEMGSGGTPALLKEPDQSQGLFVIMPMRL